MGSDELVEKFNGTAMEEVAQQISGAPDKFREELRAVLQEIVTYEEADLKEDVLRELMKHCDALVSSYQDNHPELPEEFSRINDLLWSWFQDPPETTEELQEILGEHLEDIMPYIAGEEKKEKKGGRCKAETASGSRCRNKAKHPEDNPIYCATHEDKLEAKIGEADENEPESDTEKNQAASAFPDTETDVLVSQLDVDPTIAADFLMEANEQLETLDNLLIEVEDNPDEASLNELFRCMHSLKGGFGFCGLETCTKLTHAAEDLLGILREDIPDTIPASWLDLMFATLDSVRSILVAMEKAVEEESRELEIPLSKEFVNLLMSDLRTACEGETEREAFSSLEKQKEESGIARQEVGEETINVGLRKIGKIVDLVGELVISHSGLRDQLSDHIDYQLENMLNQQDKILDQLQRRTMNLRMLPLKKEFNKFPRIVRDLARDTDKIIDLKISGAETEIDKSVLDSLHDPLLHLVRNAADHGIETPEKRRAAGKPATGTIWLRAYHESGNVYIELEEDGAGLNRAKIEEKAIERGVINKEHSLKPEEIDRLIFNAGFSTADQVSDVSGRGVGLDVVASQIDKLRGTITIDSRQGEGTKFTVELPLTVAIIDGLIAQIGRERMIFPVNQVVESVNPQPGEIQFMQGKGRVLRYRDSVIPLIDPGEFVESADVNHEIDKRTILVVVRSNQGLFAVRVDKLFSHEQVVIKNLGKGEVEDAELVSGGAILGDGSVGLIIDVASLIRVYRRERTQIKK